MVGLIFTGQCSWANISPDSINSIRHKLDGVSLLYSEDTSILMQQSTCVVEVNLGFDNQIQSFRYQGRARMLRYELGAGAVKSAISFPETELALSNRMSGLRVESTYANNTSTLRVFSGKDVLYLVTIAFDFQKKPISTYIQYNKPIFGSKVVEYYEAYCGLRISELGSL